MERVEARIGETEEEGVKEEGGGDLALGSSKVEEVVAGGAIA